MKSPMLRAAGALLAASGLAGCVVAPAPAPYAVTTYPGVPYGGTAYVVAPAPPPPPVREVIGVAPAPGYIWISGYWNWVGGRYTWERGRWEAPRPGYRWVPHRWERDGGAWRGVPGHWQRY